MKQATTKEIAETIKELSDGKIEWQSLIEPTDDFDGLIQVDKNISIQIGCNYFLVVQNFKGDKYKGKETRWSGNVMPMTNELSVIVEQILNLRNGKTEW